MIAEIIKERAAMLGVTNSNLAEKADVTPAMISNFLNGKTSLSIGSLEKLLDALDIDLSIYERRREFASKCAEILLQENYDVEEVGKMTMDELYEVVEDGRLYQLYDCESEDDFDSSAEADSLVSLEATYQYFLAMVLHYMKLKGKVTPKNVENSYKSLGSSLGLVAAAGLFGIVGVAGALGYQMYKFLSTKSNETIYKETAPIINIARKLIKNK